MDKIAMVPESCERDLDESRADLVAGRVVDGTAMRDRLRASIGALEPATPATEALLALRR